MLRLKSGLWVRSTLRRFNLEGSSALILQKGDEDAGSIFIILIDPEGKMAVLQENQTTWKRHNFETNDLYTVAQNIDIYLERQKKYDPDLWIIEINVKNCSTLIERYLGTRTSPYETFHI